MSSSRRSGARFASSSQTAKINNNQQEQEQQSGTRRQHNNYLVLGKGKKASGVATGNKINVLKPVNLPSLKKEHEGQDSQPKFAPSTSVGGWSLKQPQIEEDSGALTSSSGVTTLPSASNWGKQRSAREQTSKQDKQIGVLNPEEFPTLRNAVAKEKGQEERVAKERSSNKSIRPSQSREVEYEWEFEERRISHLVREDDEWLVDSQNEGHTWQRQRNQRADAFSKDKSANPSQEIVGTEDKDERGEFYDSYEIDNVVQEQYSTNIKRSPWKQDHAPSKLYEGVFDPEHVPPGFPNKPHQPPPPPSSPLVKDEPNRVELRNQAIKPEKRVEETRQEEVAIQPGPLSYKGNNIGRWSSQGNLEERVSSWNRGGMNQRSASYGSLNAKDSYSQEGSLESQQHRKVVSQRVHMDNSANTQRCGQNGNDFAVQEIRGGEASLYSNSNSNEESIWKQSGKIWTNTKAGDKRGTMSKRELGVGQIDFQQQTHLQDTCSTSQTGLQGIDAEMIARFGIDDIEEEEQWQSWNRTNVVYKEEQQNDIRKPREIRDSNYFSVEPQARKLPSVETSQLVSNKPSDVGKGSSQMTSTAPMAIKAKVVGIKMDKQLQAQGIQLPEDLHPDQCSSDAVNSPPPTHTQHSLSAAGQHVESIPRLPRDFDSSVAFVKSHQQPHQQQLTTNISPSLYHIPQQQQQQQQQPQYILGPSGTTTFAAPPQHAVLSGVGLSVGVGVAPNEMQHPTNQHQAGGMPLQPIDYVISGWQVGRHQQMDVYRQQYNQQHVQNWTMGLKFGETPQMLEQFQVPVLVTPLPQAQPQVRKDLGNVDYSNQTNHRVVSRSVQTNTIPMVDDLGTLQRQQDTLQDNGGDDDDDDGDIVEVSRVRRYRARGMYNNVGWRGGRGGRGIRGGYQISGRVGIGGVRGSWRGNDDWRRGDMRSRRGGFRMRGGGVRDSSRGRASSSSARSQ